MKQETFFVDSAFDGTRLHALLLTPEDEPLGLVQFCHGMAEYKERYLPFMEWLCEKGFACLIHDHRGHGQSVGCAEDLGYFGPRGDEAVIEDTHQLTLWLRERFPGLPLTLFGHSMGSLIVRCYLQKYDADLDALVVSGCVSQNPAGPAGLFLVKMLEKLKGERHRSAFIAKMTFGSYNKNFLDAVSPNAWLNSDPAPVAAYDADPLCGFTFTLNGYKALFGLIIDCYRKDGWAMKNPDLPIHFVSGADDPCLTNEEKFKEAAAFLRERGYRNVTARLFEGMRHEVLNEPEHEKVWKEVEEKLKIKDPA